MQVVGRFELNHRCLNLEEGHQALDLLRLIRQHAIDAFEAAYGTQPRATETQFPPTHSTAYLQWISPTATGRDAGASGGSVAGLNATMLVLKAYLMFKQTEAQV
ncbi:hypothetical protein [Hydrogenophaga sp.]|uniref:hypothetical protein n=1 Tax=Hydrogenophaga sp. TaxID=1904254 RepID=UPI003F6A8EC8